MDIGLPVAFPLVDTIRTYARLQTSPPVDLAASRNGRREPLYRLEVIMLVGESPRELASG